MWPPESIKNRAVYNSRVWQTDRQTEFSSLDRVCIAARYKIFTDCSWYRRRLLKQWSAEVSCWASLTSFWCCWCWRLVTSWRDLMTSSWRLTSQTSLRCSDHTQRYYAKTQWHAASDLSILFSFCCPWNDKITFLCFRSSIAVTTYLLKNKQ